ncbi:hypothetical protein [Halovivax limisalsi]|uniref:hypothetical protein n=1 Tax=Halovivax limisalsi TaxID=1453760 RepID=UPI001FFD70E9|nr:hypothetical protein [Halovivax limisalsi]
MGELSTECKRHLEDALEADDSQKKDFHIRQVLQAAEMDDAAVDHRRVPKH